MIKTKHTPGPWIQHARLIYAKEGNICEVSEPRKSWIIRHDKLEIGSADWDEGMANARLIAAAPELLDALDALTNATIQATSEDGDVSDIDGSLIYAAHAAIAKATREKS